MNSELKHFADIRDFLVEETCKQLELNPPTADAKIVFKLGEYITAWCDDAPDYIDKANEVFASAKQRIAERERGRVSDYAQRTRRSHDACGADVGEWDGKRAVY